MSEYLVIIEGEGDSYSAYAPDLFKRPANAIIAHQSGGVRLPMSITLSRRVRPLISRKAVGVVPSH